ncbi:unnamed protein product [Cuscuta europaea]|uniref:Protein kinase domain-containing protein n=1 Tax=Cuscuta europaea TaxID=41803 RepID=A0A9P1ELQ3_CUSEU|nr:unnamed protein product [Cuscuta europaea]
MIARGSSDLIMHRIDYLNVYSGPDRLRRVLTTFCLRKDDLMEIVNGYSEDCFIAKFQFGEVYRGIYDGKEVIVKVWKDDLDTIRPGDNESRFYDELKLQEYFARHSFHPNMAKVIGYCNRDKQLALAYHLKPKAIDTLRNLIEKDNFTWSQRIKAALGFASLLEFMHSRSESPTRLPYLIRNIDPANIMVDEDYEPVLFDLSMVSGGILTDKRHLVDQYPHRCNNYVDPICAHPGKWSVKSDVYSFGVLLLELITKGECKGPGPNSQSRHSLVHPSLNVDSNFRLSDAIKITKLATDCVKYDPLKRPSMKQVVRCLQNLHVVRHHANTWDINKMLNGDDAILRCVKCHGKKPDKRLKFTQAQFLKFLSITRFTPLSRTYSRDPNHWVSGQCSWCVFL